MSEGKKNCESVCKFLIADAFNNFLSSLTIESRAHSQSADIIKTLMMTASDELISAAICLSDDTNADASTTNELVSASSEKQIAVDDMIHTSADMIITSDDNNSSSEVIIIASVVGTSDDNNSSDEMIVETEVSISCDDNNVDSTKLSPQEYYQYMVNRFHETKNLPPSRAGTKGLGSSNAGGLDIHMDSKTSAQILLHMEKVLDKRNISNPEPIYKMKVNWAGNARSEEIQTITKEVRSITYYQLELEAVEIDLKVIMCCLCDDEFLNWYIYINAESIKWWGHPIFVMRYGDASKPGFEFRHVKKALILYSACVAGPMTSLGRNYYVNIINFI